MITINIKQSLNRPMFVLFIPQPFSVGAYACFIGSSSLLPSGLVSRFTSSLKTIIRKAQMSLHSAK